MSAARADTETAHIQDHKPPHPQEQESDDRLRTAREAHWLKENREAIEDYNRRVAEGGVFGDDLRAF